MNREPRHHNYLTLTTEFRNKAINSTRTTGSNLLCVGNYTSKFTVWNQSFPWFYIAKSLYHACLSEWKYWYRNYIIRLGEWRGLLSGLVDTHIYYIVCHYHTVCGYTRVHCTHISARTLRSVSMLSYLCRRTIKPSWRVWARIRVKGASIQWEYNNPVMDQNEKLTWFEYIQEKG